MTISDWFNKTSMNSVKSFALVVVFTAVVIYFSVIAGIMLLDNTSAAAVLSKDPGLRAAAQTTESSHHSYGMQVVSAILQLMALAIGVNAASVYGDRVTSREHTEAKEKGKITGAAIAASIAGASPPATQEHEAPKVNINASVEEK